MLFQEYLMQLTLSQLESLLRTLDAGGASEFEYEDDKLRLKIAFPRGAAVSVGQARRDIPGARLGGRRAGGEPAGARPRRAPRGAR